MTASNKDGSQSHNVGAGSKTLNESAMRMKLLACLQNEESSINDLTIKSGEKI